ncbi:urease accessory protein UreD [Carbonactinospora thermoautotrophica]|uniref:urease accessory protein UreD n=2 Tax=Carbonactinospora thermoautotrophica TaxID=1469144 RepID=UPI00226F9D04|nr:urease accessory protein UreD [Carbonactinospora thermoautotrophica]
MRAQAIVGVAADQGRSRFVQLRSQPPLTLRPTGSGCLHLVASAAGPLGGDELRLTVHVGPRADLELRGLGALLALPGGVARPATMLTELRVADGAWLDARFPPTILGRGCLLHSRLSVELAQHAGLLWSEVTVLGRHAEPSGRAVQTLSVTRGGRPLLRATTDLRDPALYRSPAVLGVARAVGHALVVPPQDPRDEAATHAPTPDTHAMRDGCYGAVHKLAAGHLVCVVGSDARLVTRHLEALVTPLLEQAGGASGGHRRPHA